MVVSKMAAPMRVPVVVILGATGTGKSKLALSLAKIFGGEIISADSMQVYKGLDIITNKVTKEEMHMCPHHLIDFISPLKENYSIVEFRDQAISLIDSLLLKETLPIVVGGTNYYIESLLWKYSIDQQTIQRATSEKNKVAESQSSTDKWNDEDASLTIESRPASSFQNPRDKESTKSNTDSDFSSKLDVASLDESKKKEDERKAVSFNEKGDASQDEKRVSSPDDRKDKKEEVREQYQNMETSSLYQRLKSVDPVRCKQLHPRNRRKIIRALEVYDKYGVTMTTALEAQKEDSQMDSHCGPLRYQDVCVLWIQCDLDVLGQRTDARVDEMIASGLVEEMLDFHQQYNAARAETGNLDYTHGIFQSIGFKEFHDYLLLSEGMRESEESKQLFKQCVDRMKQVTRKYSRKQIKAIRGRFLQKKADQRIPVYALDGTDKAKWRDNVELPAVAILKDLLKGRKPSHEPLPTEDGDLEVVHRVCDVCQGRVFVYRHEWESHINSRKHRKQAAGLKRKIDRHLMKESEKSLQEYQKVMAGEDGS